jgi:hypothetical protein
LREPPGRHFAAVGGRQRHLGRGERLDHLSGLAPDPASDQSDQQRGDTQDGKRGVGHPATEQHIANTQLAGRGSDHDRGRPFQRRGAQCDTGGRVTPGIGRLLGLRIPGVERTGIGGVPLQRFPTGIGPAESLL